MNTTAAEQTLADALMRIHRQLGLDFPNRTLIKCEDYFHTEGRDLSDVIDMTGNTVLAGTVVSVIGSVLITEYDGQLLVYNLKKFIGHRAQVVQGAVELEIPNTQLTLF